MASSQIGLHHAGIGQHIERTAGGDLAALLKCDGLIGKLGEKRHLVIDDAKGRAMRAQIAQHVFQVLDFVVAEPREGGVLIRPAVILPVEVYTPERKAQFLLSNAVNAADYAGAVAAVRAMGLDPNTIPHYKPPGA